MITQLCPFAFLSPLLVSVLVGCAPCCEEPAPAPADPPAACEWAPDDEPACMTETGRVCDDASFEGLCPTDISPGSDSGCTFAGRCASDVFLSLYCCEPATITASASPDLPPYPEYPGDAACRVGDYPGMWGCYPAWYFTGLGAVPGACTTCGGPGEEAWMCEDASVPAQSNCSRLGDAPYQGAGFYCCWCST